ncbi:hypothetical protein [Oceanobacter mangrovi]|uniref:hypothetical protein n=1 Tax=Oceanobacter mangrovi TaxID=2862510 RepID=UPI001C8D3960|nr:hypothetical protein [Oceanobacter mangrovi]
MFRTLVLVLALSGWMGEAVAACNPESPGLLSSLYLNGLVLLRSEELRDTEIYNVAFGGEHTRWCLSDNLEASVVGQVYYSQREIRLETARIHTQILGLGLARLEYNTWTPAQGFTPYGILNLERTNTHQRNSNGTTVLDHSSVFVWGIGIEQTIGPGKVLTLDLSHRLKFDKIASDRIADETLLTLKVNFLALLK